MNQVTLSLLSQASKEQFVGHLGHIFEHAPWVAVSAWDRRPFSSLTALHQAMVASIEAAPYAERLALIRNHPELGGKLAAEGKLTADSTKEQAGAGLDTCNGEEITKLRALNKAYLDKHGFPFVIAVKGLDKYQIFAALEARTGLDTSHEFQTCLQEIAKIGLFRLRALLGE